MASRRESWLRLVMRVVGTGGLLAFPCALMPESWMNAIHEFLGMGPLPSEPIVGYLARSTSLFYAGLGGLLWGLSNSPGSYRALIRYVGGAVFLFGLLLFAIDHGEGLPRWWWLFEGPFSMAYGAVILVLSSRLGPDREV